MDGMLRGLRVVEGSSYAGVAHAGRQLAAWGADVIRVDPVGGVAARIDPALHDGKRSIALDIRRPRGQALLAQLLGAPGPLAGVWCTDWREHAAPDGRVLADARDNLVVVHLADDGTAHAGLAGQAACSALLAALFRRERSGCGGRVTLRPDDAGATPPAQRFRRSDLVTRDGERVALDAMAGDAWPQVLNATGLAAAAAALAYRLDANLADDGQRRQHADALAALLAPWFAARTLAEVRAVFERHRVAWQPAPGTVSAIGRHTDEVLAEVLGLSASQIGRLHDEGVVAGPRSPRSVVGWR